MGNSASDIGSVVGNAIVAPFKAIFGRSCENICSGIWDVECFIEHLCVPDLVKLLLVCGLCYVCLIFVYSLFKLGVCQCVVKSLCKIGWAACETYWLTLDYICCFCWYKIRYTKRVYRRRRRWRGRLSRNDVELGRVSTSTLSDEIHYDRVCESSSADERGMNSTRKRKSRKWGRSGRRVNRRKTMRLKRGRVSIRLKGKSRRGRRRSRLKQSQRMSLDRSRKNRSSAKFKRPKIHG